MAVIACYEKFFFLVNLGSYLDNLSKLNSRIAYESVLYI